MKTLFVASLVLLAACTSTVRYDAVASSCQAYAAALSTAAVLNKAGKLTPTTQSRIEATIGPAQAVCSGLAPSDDPAAVKKVADLVIAVLNAQQEAK